MASHDDILPIRIDATSNGEFAPVAAPPAIKAAQREARTAFDRHARRVDQPRREFLTSLCGAATTLLTFTAAQAALDSFGRRKAAGFDPQTDVFATYGPKTRAEHRALLAEKRGAPG